MRIHRVSMRPFGRFAGRDVDLAPGLNVVYGPNEAGKSTLHQALLTAVGGIRRGSGRRPEVEELRNRYRPWDGTAWRVGAIVELADGTRVELVRNLDQSNGSRVTELGTGRDRAGELIVDGAPDGWQWLGLTRATYPATASVRQADVLRVGESSGLLAEQMQLAADTAGTDATAARAIERIVAYQREHVGSLSRTSVHPLRQAIVAVEQAQSRLDEAREAHAGYLRLAAEAQRLEQAAGERACERRAVEASLAAHRAHDERRELERVEELRLRHPAPPPDPTEDDRLAQSAAAALSAWSCTRQPAPLEGASATELQRRLDALPEVPTGDTAPDPSVRHAAEAVAATSQSRRVHESRRPPAAQPPPTRQPVERLQDLARTLDANLDASGARSWAARSAPILVVAGLIAILGFAAFAVLRSPLWLVAALAVALVVGVYAWAHGHALPADLTLRRERVHEAAAEAAGLGLPADPPTLRALAHQVALSQQAAATAERWEEEHLAHEADERAAEHTLRETLAARGAPDLATYEGQCEARRQAMAAAALRRPLAAQLSSRRELEAEAARAAAERGAALLSLQAAARSIPGPAAIGSGPADETAAGVEEWLRHREVRLAAEQRAQSEWHELRSLLQVAPREERARRLADADREAQTLAAGVPADALARAIGRQDPPSRVRALAGEEARARTEADHARGQLDQHPSQRLSVPEAQEAFDRATANRRRIEERGTALDLARRYLESAQDRIHRDLAPVLAHTLATWLPDITGGRYQDANVDPANLSVTVCGADRDWRDADLLSRGTQEQVYLLLRLALVEHLTRKGESAPLLLDEVTVHSDGERTEALLALFQRVAATHQVILFTQERAVRDWAAGVLDPGKDRLIEL